MRKNGPIRLKKKKNPSLCFNGKFGVRNKYLKQSVKILVWLLKVTLPALYYIRTNMPTQPEKQTSFTPNYLFVCLFWAHLSWNKIINMKLNMKASSKSSCLNRCMKGNTEIAAGLVRFSSSSSFQPECKLAVTFCYIRESLS